MVNGVIAWIAALCAFAALLFLLLWLSAWRRQARRDAAWRRGLADLANESPLAPPGAATAHSIAAVTPPDDIAQSLATAAQSLRRDRAAAARALNELEDVLSSLQDAVLLVDGDARLRFLNSAATNLFAVRIEDVLGATLLEALPSFGLETAMRAALDEGVGTAQEVNLYGGAVREVFLRVAPVRRADGGVGGAVAIIQDTSEMRRLERVRRDFVANASHELRTPIANIRAGAETILDSPEDPALIGRFLPHLVSEAERLSRLVTDLLDLARADSGAETPRALCDLAAVTCQVVENLTGKAERNGVNVYCDCASPVAVRGDASALEQVIFNLLDNALMYTPRGGRVMVGTWHDSSDGSAVLVVSDNGIGIPAADLPRVFERFYRIDKARSRAQGGTGLGLAIVKHIVENHGGHVKVECEAGHGTTFTVTLPAEAGQTPPGASIQPASSACS